jgi:hypothetical protein
VDKVDCRAVLVRIGLVEVKGALLVAVDDGERPHAVNAAAVDFEEAAGAHDGAFGK